MNPIGGRQGLGGLRLTYRVLELQDGGDVKLEIRSGSTDGETNKKFWNVVSFAPREIWTCRERRDEENRWKILDVTVEREKNVLEVRTRTYTKMEVVGDQSVPVEKTENYLVEVPILEQSRWTTTPQE